MQKSIWQRLRISFSLYQMPVFAFAACQYPFADITTLILAFVAIHVFIYPADNSYNAYFEHKSESLAHKPGFLVFPVVLEICGLLLAAYLSWEFAVMLIVYGLFS